LVLDTCRAEVVAAAERNGLSNVRVFGSVAKNEDTLTSDIDLLVAIGQKTSLLEIVEFGREVESITGYKVDVVTDTNLGPESEIIQEALSL
jgi:predicted nucleotidyltransferase